MAIPIGKMALYTVAGGVSPFHTMPVALDVGTERMDLINDPNYLGVRQKRLRGEDYYKFLDHFVDAVWSRWPDAVIQWEDLSKTAAFFGARAIPRPWTIVQRRYSRHGRRSPLRGSRCMPPSQGKPRG